MLSFGEKGKTKVVCRCGDKNLPGNRGGNASWLPLVQVQLGFPQGARSARGRGVCGRGEGVPPAWSLEVEWGVINPSQCPGHKGALTTAVRSFLLQKKVRSG